jgi:hypothetical protein
MPEYGVCTSVQTGQPNPWHLAHAEALEHPHGCASAHQDDIAQYRLI